MLIIEEEYYLLLQRSLMIIRSDSECTPTRLTQVHIQHFMRKKEYALTKKMGMRIVLG